MTLTIIVVIKQKMMPRARFCLNSLDVDSQSWTNNYWVALWEEQDPVLFLKSFVMIVGTRSQGMSSSAAFIHFESFLR